ncbi:hypothetical protein N657DRAFT_687182 [Parathielavia appendiculata]|uniref:Non-canonical purine NTP phosphatase/PRRC1 domain-containing protein n=1 Tax=Parathielavia appendiculata TaxID=2587402 RepID=A0AAN6U5R2_9PEZI|nr:hypothetical protein N657DRAFT_687182 [Parathielavia appendiculata]
MVGSFTRCRFAKLPMSKLEKMLDAANRSSSGVSAVVNSSHWYYVSRIIECQRGNGRQGHRHARKEHLMSSRSGQQRATLSAARHSSRVHGGDFDPEDETEEVMSQGMMMLGKARTATYYLPLETSRLVKEGKELGQADEVIFAGRNLKQKNISVGLLTGDVIDPGGYYEDATVLALILVRSPSLTV